MRRVNTSLLRHRERANIKGNHVLASQVLTSVVPSPQNYSESLGKKEYWKGSLDLLTP